MNAYLKGMAEMASAVLHIKILYTYSLMNIWPSFGYLGRLDVVEYFSLWYIEKA